MRLNFYYSVKHCGLSRNFNKFCFFQLQTTLFHNCKLFKSTFICNKLFRLLVFYLKVVSGIFFTFSFNSPKEGKPLKNDEKWFLFHVKSSFRSQDIKLFVSPSSPRFCPVSHCWKSGLNKCFKIDDVMKWLNNNFKIHIDRYLRK